MSKHTPGPWIADDLCMADDHRVRVGTTNGTATYYHRTATICECAVSDPEDACDNDPNILVAEANARLIAAAPDLLALAHQYAAECSNCDGSGLITISDYDGIGSDADDQPCPDCVDIRAVIAKVEAK